jgi:GT2 family glycosyltransferase
MSSAVRLSILVSTRNRAGLLPEFLDRLRCVLEREPAAEALVVDNDSCDETAAILAAWAGGGERRRWLTVRPAGKSRALNAAARASATEILAFTDDDVRLPEDWAAAILRFFERPQFGALAGRILLPPEVIAEKSGSAWMIEAQKVTLPLLDFGEQVSEAPFFYGANFAIRSELFAAVGGFCERLGPGASGLYEDTDLAARLRRHGVRIGYDPAVVVFHLPDDRRLTARELWARALAFARSERILEGPRAPVASILRCVEAIVGLGLARVTRNPRRFWHARFRLRRHLAHLWLSYRERREGAGKLPRVPSP